MVILAWYNSPVAAVPIEFRMYQALSADRTVISQFFNALESELFTEWFFSIQ